MQFCCSAAAEILCSVCSGVEDPHSFIYWSFFHCKSSAPRLSTPMPAPGGGRFLGNPRKTFAETENSAGRMASADIIYGG